MFEKLKMKWKWVIGRKKVLKRYLKIMNQFPQPPVYIENEEFSDYSNRILKHLMLIERVRRLHRIYKKYYSWINEI